MRTVPCTSRSVIVEEEVAGTRRPYANKALAVLTPRYGEAQRVSRDVRVELADLEAACAAVAAAAANCPQRCEKKLTS